MWQRLRGSDLHDAGGRTVSKPAIGSAGISQTELTTIFAARTAIDGDVLTHGWTTDLRRQGRQLAAIITCRTNDVNGPLERNQHVGGSDAGVRRRQPPASRGPGRPRRACSPLVPRLHALLAGL
ncbi:putative nucleic acid-binding Zn ribbon protein [Arthrobacter pascens]|uniref:hypothetical protein n=1 Tax=Arthrobacter pascens TaxID=1677 RepID=UPI002791B583|nr:hypothetical protein [Arthrobacter pascens]MDQ0680734.1 putative nucleic acid-binding Zn ribbon protein [Arthrobacter pascens]